VTRSVSVMIVAAVSLSLAWVVLQNSSPVTRTEPTVAELTPQEESATAPSYLEAQAREGLSAADDDRVGVAEPAPTNKTEKKRTLAELFPGWPIVHAPEVPSFDYSLPVEPIEEGTYAAQDRDWLAMTIMVESWVLRSALEDHGVPLAEALDRCAPDDARPIKSQDRRFCEDLRPAEETCVDLLKISERFQDFLDRAQRSSESVQAVLAAKALELAPMVALANRLCSP